MQFVLKCFRICLFVFNFFYFLFGIGFLITALYLHFSPTRINELIKLEFGMQHDRLVYLLVGLAIFSLLVGLIGCSGILSKKSWLLFVYFVCLFIIFGLQFAAAIYLNAKSLDYFNDLTQKLIEIINTKYGAQVVYTQAIDYIQSRFLCCGWHSPKDWFNSSYLSPNYKQNMLPASYNIINEDSAVFTNSNRTFKLVMPSKKTFLIAYKIPESCCEGQYDLNCVLKNRYHELGCKNFVSNYFKQIEVSIAWVMAFLNLFQLVLLVLSLYFLCIIFFDKNLALTDRFRKSFSHPIQPANKYKSNRPLLAPGRHPGVAMPVTVSGQVPQATYYNYWPGQHPQYATTFAL